ncbi:NAD(P)/FAD-dependent oxidoreductase [Tessaracoccus sp. Z1128]
MSGAGLRRIVVVGYGIAGLTAADQLRSSGFDGELTVVGEERHHPYSRPALSKAALVEDGEMTAHELPAPRHDAAERLGIAATSVDAGRRIVGLADGSELPYDRLVIASGSRAGRLADRWPVADGVQELVVRTVEDARVLRERVASKPSVVVVGGGPLGMELASACLASGCGVTLVAQDRPMTRLLGEYLSQVFVRAAQARGLTVAASPAVRVHAGDGGRPTVTLADGTSVTADLLVSAVGDVPNLEWLVGSGLLAGGALVVDTRGRVRPDIVAAGDVASFPTPQGIRRIPLWTSAIEQAKVAAVAALRDDDAPELAFQPYFWTDQFGLSLKAVGATPVTGRPEILDGAPHEGSGLLRWGNVDGSVTAAALNYRIPVPRLRRLAAPSTVGWGPNSASVG